MHVIGLDLGTSGLKAVLLAAPPTAPWPASRRPSSCGWAERFGLDAEVQIAACASCLGMRQAHARDDLSYAVLEGMAFAFGDGMAALREAGNDPARLLALGGGARSGAWLQMLADALQRPIDRPACAELAPRPVPRAWPC